MTPARSVPEPIAVFSGRHWLRWAADPTTLITLGIAATITATATARYLPWPSALGGGALAGLALVVWLAGCALAVALQRWARARVGRAELFADRLVVLHERQLLHIDLREVVVFDDRSSDFVQVVLERAEWVRPRLTLTVPTPDDTARAALVSALASAGVPRDDGQPEAPPREPEGLGPALLVIEAKRHPVVVLIWLLCLPVYLVAWASASSPPGDAAATAMLLAIVAPIAAWILARPRTGKVWFLDTRIVVDPMHVSSPPGWRCVLAWDDVIGWHAHSGGYLRLVLRPGLPRDAHREPSIPTRTREDRAAVEALLATRGVPRL